MDVGIEAKVEGTKVLPDVTPIHGVPAAVAKAPEGLIDSNFLDFSQLAQGLSHAQGAADGGRGFQPQAQQGRVHLADRAFGLWQVHGADHGRRAERDLQGRDQALDGRGMWSMPIPERAVVFQAPSLFPWLTAKENVAVGVDRVYPRASRRPSGRTWSNTTSNGSGSGDAMDKPAADLCRTA